MSKRRDLTALRAEIEIALLICADAVDCLAERDWQWKRDDDAAVWIDVDDGDEIVSPGEIQRECFLRGWNCRRRSIDLALARVASRQRIEHGFQLRPRRGQVE